MAQSASGEARVEEVALAAILAVIGSFQAALAAGAPWGAAAYGGESPGVLPGRLRTTSAVAAPLYLGAAAAIATPGTPEALRRGVLWAAAPLLSVGTLANLATPSPIERALWAPTAAAGAALAWRALARARRSRA
ncbi:MAG: hypothetical protein L0G22_11275 [Propionibacteriaceae bacterium]|nr:hypothetical protein [Propionibacteriaceae bacterium]